ncbi:amino acid adenylation domain-containing protein [Streptomyces sp. ERV7]|uniref:amino acid adenylation domain-containing protein n=1 Tax=Streptomyces sp. ERV7 TaxID=1322334 RepID=UPI000B024200|nr:amino acid adenylation domain-containing protein [Streptomyces sp. ERV7]
MRQVDIAADAESHTGLRCRNEELYRPLPTGSMVDGVLLRYADGPTDMVLIACRAVLDAPSLRALADATTGVVAPEALEPAPAQRVLRTPTCSAVRGRRDFAAGFGSGQWAASNPAATDRTGVIRTSLKGESRDVLAPLAVAAGIALGRYEDQRHPVIGAVPGAAPRQRYSLGGADFAMLLDFDLDAATDTAELIVEARHRLAAPDDHWDPTRFRTAAEADVGRVMVGFLPEARTGELPCQTAPFPLTLVPRRHSDDSLELEAHYRLRDVDPDTAERFVRHAAHVYEQITQTTGSPTPDDVELLDSDERRAVVAAGGSRASALSIAERIDTMFAAQAAERPDAVALRSEGRSLTYAQLQERARRCAAGLRALGVVPGDRVGLLLGRSPDLIVTILAVLQADAVYVPMDPAYPADRLAHTMADAGVRVVVSDRDDGPDVPGIPVVRPAEITAQVPSASLPAPRGGADSPAYVIYTSGSTGQPKGVVVPHRGVVSLIAATQEDFALSPDDVWTLFHSSAFDFSVWEIWGALLTGGTLVVVPYWVSRSPEEFHRLLVDERATVVSQTPTAFMQLAEADRWLGGADLALRLVIFGGEPLDARSLGGWLDRHPAAECRLVNMYGITETTVHVTAHTLTRHDVQNGTRSVGRVLPGWRVYVLDKRLRPVPFGAPGEIYVAGAGVALEYLDRPQLTRDRFLPDPWAGGLMYRSGDRGRLRPDGVLEHLGRLDDQVKLRGFRIEPDEISAALLADPAVVSAAVVLEETIPRDPAGRQIAAYVVLSRGEASDVRRRLAAVLPEFMVPASVTALDALPLTLNGKLDRKRLPFTAAQRAESGGRGRAAADGGWLLRDLLTVWEDVLQVPIGPHDNFFETGANSLHVMRVSTALRERGLPTVPLRQLYLHPTASRLARFLDSGYGHHESEAGQS